MKKSRCTGEKIIDVLKQMEAGRSLDREALKAVIRKSGWSLQAPGGMWRSSSRNSR